MQQHQYDLTELVGRLPASPTVGGLYLPEVLCA